jgi:hypothetical protein
MSAMYPNNILRSENFAYQSSQVFRSRFALAIGFAVRGAIGHGVVLCLGGDGSHLESIWVAKFLIARAWLVGSCTAGIFGGVARD